MFSPRYNPDGLNIVRKHLLAKKKLRSLDDKSNIPVIATGCPSLDWITDCGGLPRGRIVVFVGPESSGKCVSLNTLVGVHNRGIISMKELSQGLPWKKDANGEVIGDQHVDINIQVPDADSTPTTATAIYYAGILESHKVATEDGNELIGSKTHRILTLSERGMLTWTMLRDVKLKSVVVKTVGQRISGPSDKIFEWDLPRDDSELTLRQCSTASLFGALSTVEKREDNYYLTVTDPRQIMFVRRWAREMMDDEMENPFDDMVSEFSKFSGLVKIRPGKWLELALGAIKVSPLVFKTASLSAQAHWCAGVTLVKGVWTKNDLEFEIQDKAIAQTLHTLLENIGVRTIIYPTMNIIGGDMMKLAIRDRIAQQEMESLVWKGYKLPPDWKGRSVLENVETHPYITETLNRAKEFLIEEGQFSLAESFESDDLDKDNLIKVSEILFSYSRKKKSADRIYQTLLLMSAPTTYLDRVTFSKSTGVDEAMMDLQVPIGTRYSTAGLVSHNSTAAMHCARVELAGNPNAVVAYQDFEHSFDVRYGRKMGLHKYSDRFFLIPSDEFEEAEKYHKFFMENKIFPSLWIVDSVPAMVPHDEFERDPEDNPQIAKQARMMSMLLSKWAKFAGTYGTTFLLLNQLRAYIPMGFMDKGRGVVGIPGSEKEQPAGGYAMRFYPSLTIDFRPSTIIKAQVYNPYLAKKDDRPIAVMVKMTVRKNKCGAPFKSAMAYMQFGEGFDNVRTIFDLAINQGLIQKGKNKDGEEEEKEELDKYGKKKKGSNTYVVQISDSQTLSAVGQENFINALKGKDGNTLGPQVLEFLQKALQWDKADQIHSEVLGLVEEDVETGVVTSIEGEDDFGEVDEGMIQYIRSLESVSEQADSLKLFSRKKKTIYWVNPETGEEFNGRRVDILEKKLPDESLVVLEGLVEDKLMELESKLTKKQEKQRGDLVGHIEKVDEGGNKVLEALGESLIPSIEDGVLGEGVLGEELPNGVTEGLGFDTNGFEEGDGGFMEDPELSEGGQLGEGEDGGFIDHLFTEQ